MKRTRTVFGKRRVDLAGITYEIRLEHDALCVHQLRKLLRIRVPLERVVGILFGVLPFAGEPGALERKHERQD